MPVELQFGGIKDAKHWGVNTFFGFLAAPTQQNEGMSGGSPDAPPQGSTTMHVALEQKFMYFLIVPC